MKQTILSSTFIRFRDRLHRVAAGIEDHSDDADDVIHDAFCRLWSKHSEVEDEVSAIKLSYTAVRNSAIDSLRRTKSHPAVTIDSVTEDSEIDDSEDYESERHETYKAVIRLSQKVLNKNQYDIFRLHDIEGLPYQKVAEDLGMTQEYVRVTLSRARKAIREIYRKQQAFE